MVKKSLAFRFIAQRSELVESGKSSSLSPFSKLLLQVWEKWDVRGMVLFSLTLQIVLSVLGRHRKYKINPFFKTILWFAYLGADWIAIATLGKLSSSYAESPATKVLRAYWGPLLLLHLGGPDTITAYAFEDNKFWIRHLLILVVKAILVAYVICLSWTFSWLSFLSFPLILAGIIKYVEKILCLKLNNSQKTKPVMSDIFNPQRHHPHLNQNQILDRLIEENPTVLRGYLLFTIMRPDVNDYLSSHSHSSTNTRIQTCVKETTHINNPLVPFRKFEYIFQYIFQGSQSNPFDYFDFFAVELEFIFDVVYTKVALIYTKLGCLLRLTSFVISLLVLLLFFISIINESKLHFSKVDIAITGILLTGAIALELFAAWVMLSSDWAILVTAFHHNMLVRKIFKAALKYFPSLLHQSKRWSNHIGQFDLLKYCQLHKNKKVNQSCGILQKITNDSDIIEMWRKYMFTNFVQVPSYLKDIENYLDPVVSFLLSDSLWASRGKRAIKKWEKYQTTKNEEKYLSWSIELDFDYSIIIWHLATSVCLYQELQDDNDEAKEISKQVSDYMMYLLAMCPALILPDHNKSFWLDHTYDELKELLFSATDITNAASILLSNPNNVHEEEFECSCSEEATMENLPDDVDEEDPDSRFRGRTFKEMLESDVSRLATRLLKSNNKWEMIRDVWIEMLVYAAVSSHHVSHVKQLGEGIEFLSIIWLFVGLNLVYQSLEHREA